MMRSRRLGYFTLKRAMDLIACAFFIPLAVPALFMIGVAIRIDSPGPIMFRQSRTGRDGKSFKMIKFRTMVENAEELKSSLEHLNVLPPPDFKIPNDPRVTRVGRFLRKTSLDELPQLFNILKGDMAIVGPRPTSFSPSTWSLWHTSRLDVPPGLTGLWQVYGRNELCFDERLRLDMQYIRRMSIWLDLKLIGLTFGSVFRRSGL